MKISVIGTGYVGLVSGVCLAAKGHDVVCVDIDESKVARINAGDPPIYEEHLEELLKDVLAKGFSATTDLKKAVHESDLSLIAVGTPYAGSEIDLRFVSGAARDIGLALKDKGRFHAVVVKSTVVPGTTDDVVAPAVAEASGLRLGVDFGVGMNPEFLKEGEAINDFMAPDRIVLGCNDSQTMQLMRELYGVFPDADKIETNARTAEMIKYTANSLLATMISFSNEIANLCSKVGGIDVSEVTKGVHLDKRITPILPSGQRVIPTFTTYIEAGCGFGGSCFPKDVKALVAHGRRFGEDMNLLSAVVEINAAQPRQMIELLKRHFPVPAGVKVTVLGLAFKPGTDDIRESPAIAIIHELIAHGSQVAAFDPIAQKEAQKVFAKDQLSYKDSLRDSLEGAEVVMLVTRWKEFEQLPELMAEICPNAVLIDGRRMLPKGSVPKYEGIGLTNA